MKVSRIKWLITLISVVAIAPGQVDSGNAEAIRESKNRLIDMAKKIELASVKATADEPPDSAYKRRNRLAFFLHIKELPEPELFAGIVKDDPSAAVRSMAAELVSGSLESDEVVHALHQALRDVHPAVRTEAASALLRQGYSEEKCVETLSEVALGKNEQDWDVSGFSEQMDILENPESKKEIAVSWRADAILALGRASTPQADRVLETLKENGVNDRYLSSLVDHALR